MHISESNKLCLLSEHPKIYGRSVTFVEAYLSLPVDDIDCAQV